MNDKEFEILVTDLLSAHFGTHIERFKPGKDRGIDGRFFADDGKTVIIQCKHYLKTGYKGLIAKCKNEEAAKVDKLKPSRYVFVTSLPLSADNKADIKKVFGRHINREDDIFGQEDLNDILAKNPNIEERHFKLWITSKTIFSRIINNAIKGRSEFELERIEKNSFKYIQTSNHARSIKILREKHVLLISGEPGIGKTTLAENLCLFYASKDFEFVNIEESLSEAESIYERDKKQIFYYDDFLGSNYLEAIENKKDSHIMKFIERIKNDPTKRFILTSRTNILNAGILYSPILENYRIKSNEFMLTIEALSAIDKARILYNHIWFSKLSEDYINELHKNKRYRKIINHKNYNPRLIEFITDTTRINLSNSSAYWDYVVNTLNNPKDIWSQCFKSQSNPYVRNLVKLTVFNGGSIAENDLRISFARLNSLEKLKNPSHTEKDFRSTSQLATRCFLNRNRSSSSTYYTLFNPSIADFILNEYCSDPDGYTDSFKSLYTLASLRHLLALKEAGVVTATDGWELKNALFKDAFEEGKSYDYLVFITYQFIHDESKRDKTIDLLTRIIERPSEITQLEMFIELLEIHCKQISIGNFEFMLRCIDNQHLSTSEIDSLIEFMDSHSVRNEDILDKLRADLEANFEDSVESSKDNLDLSDYVKFEGYDLWGEEDYCYDNDEIREKINDDAMTEYSSGALEELGIDAWEIIDRIDIDDLVADFISSLDRSNGDEYGGYRSSPDQDIDDLFERT
ncbi:MAG: restriction endonuclease [Sedimentisphaerales bacterium]|nr:restriction endonuclease [Sedimentisphaerales bacterium]